MKPYFLDNNTVINVDSICSMKRELQDWGREGKWAIEFSTIEGGFTQYYKEEHDRDKVFFEIYNLMKV